MVNHRILTHPGIAGEVKNDLHGWFVVVFG